MQSVNHIESLIEADEWRMEILYTVKQMQLPDWAIGPGFVRSAVWDAISGKKSRTALNDIDVLYFNKSDISEATEKSLEGDLKNRLPDIPWSVKNQARMHIQNKDSPYTDTADAMSHWLEVATCIGVRMRANTSVEIIAPYGIDDLLNMQARPTLRGQQKPDQYRLYLKKKNWLRYWPNLAIQEI
ncbi:MAG: nucleotidyltransferase family protein [Rhodospirillales bacterium]|nr:nucleotidyltransferase family protein [Rhodospirillales bacterium]